MNTWTIMQRIISSALALLLSFGLFNTPAFAGDKTAKMKQKIASYPIGSSVSVRLRDHRELRGRLSARGESSFQLEAPDTVSVAYADVKSVKTVDFVPPTSNNAFSRQATIGIVVIGAIIGIAIWAASQLK